MATNRQRRKLLELVFPDRITVFLERLTFNTEKTKVRTTHINDLSTLSNTEPVDYEFIEIKKRDSLSRNPALGEDNNNSRTLEHIFNLVKYLRELRIEYKL